MQYYVIGVGGTGTKCVEAFVHLCAMGVVDKPDKVEIRIVDIDDVNGNYHRLKETLDSYIKMREMIRKTGEGDWFVPELSVGSGVNFKWSTREQGDSDTLDGRINRATLDENHKLLMRALFSRKERTEMSLRVGVRGIPKVGALICAKSLNFDNQDALNNDAFWGELLGEGAMVGIRQNETRIIVIGSLFGGTGASCTPTIVKKLHKWVEDNKFPNVRIGMGLMLPYFYFNGEGSDERDEVRARADNFIINSKAAMQYYKDIGILNHADTLYFLGDDMSGDTTVKFALGIKNVQRNDAMPVEVVAGGAIHDFLYHVDNKPGEPQKIRYVKRISDGEVLTAPYPWKQFPNGNAIMKKMARLLKFSMLFNYYFYPVGCKKSESEISRVQCLTNFFGADAFKPGARPEWIKQYISMEKYCKYFIAWVKQLKKTGIKRIDMKELLPELDAETRLPIERLKKEIDKNGFDVTAIADGKDLKDGNTKWVNLIRDMAMEKKSSQEANNYSEFVNRLYSKC